MMQTLAAVALAVLAAGAGTSHAQISVDLDGDGKPDTVLLEQRDNSVSVSVHFDAASHKPQQFRFAVDAGREDAVCALPVRLHIEPLDYDLAAAVGKPVPGFVRSDAGKGFAIVDGACDSIHFYWNHMEKRLDW